MWQCNNGRVWHQVNVTSHITRRHIAYLRHIWGTSSTAGGNNSSHICQDVRFLAHRWCPPLCDGSEQTRVGQLLAAGATSDSPLVHLDYLLIAAVYTLITFVFQVIGVYPYCNHLWMVILTPCSPQFTFRHSLSPPLIWPLKQEVAKFMTWVCKDIKERKEALCVPISIHRSLQIRKGSEIWA